ncbi:MAG: hypothetical protein WDZ69_02530 [Candidatus Pacearchaeota archaeon]
MVKSYTFKEIETLFKNELNKSEHIMTFGVFGSLSAENDLDTLITKKPKSKTSDFFKEVHDLFFNIDEKINKISGGKLIRVSRSGHEEEVKYISNYDKRKDLVIQSTSYISLSQIIKAWTPDIGNSEDSWNKLERIIKNQLFLKGSVKDIFSGEFSKERNNETTFIMLDIHDRINSSCPEKFIVNKMNVTFDYILRKVLNAEPKVAKNLSESRKIFYFICDLAEK